MHPSLSSLLGVPIEYQGQAVGVLAVANKRGGQEFSLDDQQTLERLAGRLGPALEIARTRARDARDRERIKFLDDVSVALSETLDYELVVERMAELAVPRLADWCLIYLLEEGRWRSTACLHADPEKATLLARVHDDPRCGPSNPATMAARAAATKQVVWAADCGEALLQVQRSAPELAGLLRQLSPKSYLAAPLVLDGRLLGVMTLAYCDSPRRYEEGDLPLVRGVAQRAALAIENSRLYRRLQQAVRAREDMLAVVAHDLRNPLQAIDLNTRMIALDLGGPKVARLVAGIQSVSGRMKRLVNDLLDGAALDAGTVTLDLQACRIADLIDGVVCSYADSMAAKGIRLERDIVADPTSVMCDGQRIEQVLTNLLGNAVKFTPPGGTVRVTARVVGHEMEIGVSDTGKGISREKMEHLFERYWKGEEGGTGLGLYIAKRIIDAHGALLLVASPSDGGSSFHFALPIC